MQRVALIYILFIALNSNIIAQTNLEIFEIQGTGLTSPVLDQNVISEDNIVTGVASDGFFMQTPDNRADSDPETSNGLFVYLGSEPSVSIGDMITVEGRVTVYHGLTEIAGGPQVTVVSSGNPLPTPIQLNEDLPSPNQTKPENEMERYEGMLVEITNGRVTAPSHRNGYVSIVAKSTRPFREPGITYPGLPDLPVWDGNPEIFVLDPDGLGLPDLALIGGAEILYAKGPLNEYDGSYELHPIELTVNNDVSPRAIRARTPGEYIVATQNIEVFVDDVDHPIKDEWVISTEEFQTRLEKLSLYIRESLQSPDILCVQEIEGPELLEKLADKLQQDDPGLIYSTYMDERGPFYPASRASTGFMVRNTVHVDSVVQLAREATFEYENQTQATHFRPPFVLHGKFKTEPMFPVVVMVVHIKALSGIEGPGEGLVRTRRYEESLSIAREVQRMQEENPGIHLIIAGDFNAYQFTDGYVDVMGQITGNPDPLGAQFPATDIVNPNLTDQALTLPQHDQYSFSFQGSVQILDHILTSQALQPFVSGISYTRGNADFPDTFLEDKTTPARISDHDGLALFIETNVTHVEELSGNEPETFALLQNYPNPFNPITTIQYELKAAANVTLTLFDINGREVKKLINNEQTSAGRYSASWSGQDNNTAMVSSGMYFYKIEFITGSEKHSFTKKLVFIK